MLYIIERDRFTIIKDDDILKLRENYTFVNGLYKWTREPYYEETIYPVVIR